MKKLHLDYEAKQNPKRSAQEVGGIIWGTLSCLFSLSSGVLIEVGLTTWSYNERKVPMTGAGLDYGPVFLGLGILFCLLVSFATGLRGIFVARRAGFFVNIPSIIGLLLMFLCTIWWFEI